MKLCEKLYELRRAAGLSQEELQKFSSIAELKEQIARDKEDVAQEVAQNIEQMLFLDSRAQEPATFEKI